MKKTNTLTRKRAVRLLFVLPLVLAMALPVSAAGLTDSTIVTGTQQLLTDATTVLAILCPVVCGLVAIYFAIRRGMADEQDGKMWTRRITTAIICGVGGGLISATIALVASYYGG